VDDCGESPLGERETQEKKERAEREEEERSCQLSLPTNRANWSRVVPTGLEKLSHTVCSVAAGGQAAQGGWAASRATADGATQLCQTTRRESSLHGAMLTLGHVPPKTPYEPR
jgi:hypothetical protein